MPRISKAKKLARPTYNEKTARIYQQYFDALIEQGSGYVEIDSGLYGIKIRTLYNRVCDALLWLCENDEVNADKYLNFKKRIRYEVYGNGVLRILYLIQQKIVVHRLSDLPDADAQNESSAPIDPEWRDKFHRFFDGDEEECIIQHKFGPQDITYVKNLCEQMPEIKLRMTNVMLVATRRPTTKTKDEVDYESEQST